jgi:two-component sensor histidine kinase
MAANGSGRATQGVSFAQAALAQGLTAALLALATLVRARLGAGFPDLAPFTLYYPVIMVAALAGGWPAAVSALAGGGALGWWLFEDPAGSFRLPAPSGLVDLGLYAFAGAGIGLGGLYLRDRIGRLRANSARLAERELRYHTLFDAVSEGFALVRAIRGPTGRLVDYVVEEANPALLRILELGGDVVGRRQSELIPEAPPAWLEACGRALDGTPLTFEYQAPGSGRWYAIQLARTGEDRLAQFVQEITPRKIAESRQAEMFDELNHRVKNNLAMVSSLLSLQARTAPAEVGAQLQKAVGRIQTISDVHTSLYRSSRKDDVELAAYLGDLCRRLQGSLLVDDRVRLSLTAEPAILPVDQAVALGVIVNELVTNAAKHAYPPPAAGEVVVRLERVGRDLALTVADRGVGLPVEPGAGLGMRLVRSMVQQLGGALEVERGAGALFRVRLPAAGLAPAMAQPQQRELL